MRDKIKQIFIENQLRNKRQIPLIRLSAVKGKMQSQCKTRRENPKKRQKQCAPFINYRSRIWITNEVSDLQ